MSSILNVSGAKETYAANHKKTSSFSYVRPAKRRATQYEEITLHTQWDPKNFAAQGWFNLDKNGRSIWNEDATLLKARDWWQYRDPQEEWFRPFVKRQANTGRAIEQGISGAKRAGLFARLDPSWVEFLASHYAAYRYVEYGLFMVLCQAQREAGSDVVAQPIVFQSIEKDRHAQDIALYCMELEREIPGFSDKNCKSVWLSSPCWQPARRLVETLLATRDWGELNIVLNCLVEPLFSSLFNRELVLRNAPLHGDTVSSIIAEGAESDREIRRASTLAFVHLAVEQDVGNREVIAAWFAKWLPMVENAAQGLAPVFDMPVHKAQGFQQAWATVNSDFVHLKSEWTI